MPSPLVQTDHEVFLFGAGTMQMVDLGNATVLAVATKTEGGWSVSIERDATLNQTIADRQSAAAYMVDNAPAPKQDGTGWSVWVPDLSAYTD